MSGLKVNVPPLFPIACLFVYLFIYGILCLAKKSLRKGHALYARHKLCYKITKIVRAL